MSNILEKRVRRALLASMVGCLFVGASAHAADMWWADTNYTGSTWDTAAGWDTGIPGIGDNARVKTDIVIENGISAVAQGMFLSFGGTGGDVDLDMTGGSLDVGVHFYWGWNEDDTNSDINLSGDSDINIAGVFQIAPDAANNMTLNMSGGTLDVGSLLDFWNGVWTLNMSGGALTTKDMRVLGGSMLLNIDGGTFTIKDSIDQSSANIARVVDFGDGIGGGQFVVEWDFWDPTVQDQTWATRWYEWYMKSDDGFGAAGVGWHYEVDGGQTSTLFHAKSKDMFWDNPSYSAATWDTVAGWSTNGGPVSALPARHDPVYIKTDILITNGVRAVGQHVYLSYGGNGGDVDLDMTGGSLDVGTHFKWCYNSNDLNSAINLGGGDINIGSVFEIAPHVNNVAVLNMTGGTLTAETLTVLGGSMTLNIDSGRFTVEDAILQSSVNESRVVDFGSGNGWFVVEWDFWNPAEQDPTWATRWYEWYMRSDQGQGSDGVDWHYEVDGGQTSTVFHATMAITDVSVVSPDTLKLVVVTAGFPLGDLYPKCKTDLALGNSWDPILHSDGIAGTYAETNLQHSADEGGGSVAIYVKSTDPEKFFRIEN